MTEYDLNSNFGLTPTSIESPSNENEKIQQNIRSQLLIRIYQQLQSNNNITSDQINFPDQVEQFQQINQQPIDRLFSLKPDEQHCYQKELISFSTSKKFIKKYYSMPLRRSRERREFSIALESIEESERTRALKNCIRYLINDVITYLDASDIPKSIVRQICRESNINENQFFKQLKDNKEQLQSLTKIRQQLKDSQEFQKICQIFLIKEGKRWALQKLNFHLCLLRLRKFLVEEIFQPDMLQNNSIENQI